jgi:thiosulfate dehydrogenase [quinone] large subunit
MEEKAVGNDTSLIPVKRSAGFTITFFLLRLGLGGLIFEAGLDKLINGFSSAGFLNSSTGPLSGFYQSMAVHANIWDVLIPWAEVLIGAAIILGILVRFAAFWGAVEVLIFYLAVLPPSQGWINYQIVLVLVFITFMFNGIGYFLGLDALVVNLEERRHWSRFFFG